MDYKISETKTILIQSIIVIGLLASISYLLQGCTDKCEMTETYVYYEPVYTSLDLVRSAVGLEGPAEMNNPGKIYLYGQLILIGEVGKGIHVVNNSNPSSPEIISFINIPGNADMAVRNNRLYADSYMDLVVIDISDVNNIQVVDRVENVLNSYTNMGLMVASERGVITDWQEVSMVNNYESDCGGGPSVMPFNNGFLASRDVNFRAMAAESSFASSPNPVTGKGGSMARFTIQGDYLYTVDNYDMNVINIANPDQPVKDRTINLGWGIETIFPYNGSLFIGAQNGMYIYDISTPSNPEFLSVFQHVTSCDPVVVEDNFAYVTLRSGTDCMGFTNQLDVLDISNLKEPQLLKTYPMDNPHGLGINQNTLFVCEGEYGLKIFNAEDKLNIDDNLIVHFSDLDAYDVIPNGEILALVGKDGLYQYDFSDLDNIRLLSFLPINTQIQLASNSQ